MCTASTLCDIEFHKFACLSPFANTGGEGHFRDGYTLKNFMNFRKISEGGVWGVIFDRNIFSENKGELRSYLISASRILVQAIYCFLDWGEGCNLYGEAE